MPIGCSTDGSGNGSTKGNIGGDRGEEGKGAFTQADGPARHVDGNWGDATPASRVEDTKAPPPTIAPAIAFKNFLLSDTNPPRDF